MVLLDRLQTIEKEGLVGITKEGDIVKLSSSELELYSMLSSVPVREVDVQKSLMELREELDNDEEKYYQIGEPRIIGWGLAIPYNSFTRRD